MNENTLSQDGIHAWYQLKKEYAHEGSAECKADHIEKDIAIPYKQIKSSTLVNYIDQFERHATQLSTLNQKDWSHIRKVKLLRTNLEPLGNAFKHVLQKIKDEMDS